MRWSFACRKVTAESSCDQYLWESADSITGQRDKVNPDAVVRKVSLIPWVVVQLQDSSAELS